MATSLGCTTELCAGHSLTAGTRAHGRLLPAALIAGGVAIVWLVSADVVLASCGYIASKAQSGWATTVGYAAGHALGAFAIIAVACSPRLRQWAGARLDRLARTLEQPGGLLLLLGLLTVVRVAWILLVPTQPTSDNAAYHGLATRLVETGMYDTAKHRAYWPPGYPVFLTGLYAVFGPSLLVAKLGNVVLAAGVDLLTWHAVRRHVSAPAAGAALLLTALWPGRNLHVDVLSYDELVMALLLLSLVLLPRVDRVDARHAWLWMAGGLVLGLACLVRPTLGLVPAAIGGWLLVRGCSLWRAVVLTGIYGLAMLAAITPWTIRNYVVLGRFVPLTTNAGGNFYNSWAPGGTGCFHKPAWEHLWAVTGGDELQMSPTGFALGMAAIRTDLPAAIWRVAQKQVHYVGSDNWLLPVESYTAALGGNATAGDALKLGVHTLSNAWYVVLMLLPISAVRRMTRLIAAQPLAWLCIAVFATGLITHTVFEAQARYHLVYLPCWSILAACLWAGRAPVRQP